MKKILYFFLIFFIKCEKWWSELNKHSIDDPWGYSGSHPDPFTDFYLCSERKYRVHYQGDDNKTWSEEFTACKPSGNARLIDAIAISGGEKYAARIDYDWQEEITEYDIFHKNGYTGEFGRELYGLYVFGDEYYRSGFYTTFSSNENEVAKRITYNFVQKNFSFFYENETEIYNDTAINITVKLLNSSKLNFDGAMTAKIENNKTIISNYDRLITNNLNNLLKEAIDIDINKTKTSFENLFINLGIENGNIAINFYWSQNIIEIDVCSKIQNNFYSYREGFRMNINLNSEDSELLLKIQKIFKVIYKYAGKKVQSNIREILSYNKSFIEFEEVINDLDIYSTIAEEAILFAIISDILKNN